MFYIVYGGDFMEAVNGIVSIVANNGLAIALCIYYTVSFSKQMSEVTNCLTRLTEKIENL